VLRRLIKTPAEKSGEKGEFDSVECKVLVLLAKNRRLHVYDICFALREKYRVVEETLKRLGERGVVDREGLFVKIASKENVQGSKWIIISSTRDKEYYLRRGFIEVKNLLVAPYHPLLEKIVSKADFSFTAVSAAAEEAWAQSTLSMTPLNSMFKAEAALIQYIFKTREGEDDRDLAKEALCELETARMIAEENRLPSKSEVEAYAKEVYNWRSKDEVIKRLLGIFKEKEILIVNAVEEKIGIRRSSRRAF